MYKFYLFIYLFCETTKYVSDKDKKVIMKIYRSNILNMYACYRRNIRHILIKSERHIILLSKIARERKRVGERENCAIIPA